MFIVSYLEEETASATELERRHPEDGDVVEVEGAWIDLNPARQQLREVLHIALVGGSLQGGSTLAEKSAHWELVQGLVLIGTQWCVLIVSCNDDCHPVSTAPETGKKTLLDWHRKRQIKNINREWRTATCWWSACSQESSARQTEQSLSRGGAKFSCQPTSSTLGFHFVNSLIAGDKLKTCTKSKTKINPHYKNK